VTPEQLRNNVINPDKVESIQLCNLVVYLVTSINLAEKTAIKIDELEKALGILILKVRELSRKMPWS